MNRHAGPPPDPHRPPAPEPTYAERARTLVYLGRTGMLSTLSLKHPGHPFGSLMPYALDGQGRPLFLISAMAMHTQNLQADPRASLLVLQPGWGGDPLAAGRVTLMGEAIPLPDTEAPEARTAYLARHPNAEYWVDFEDFGFYRLEGADVYFVGGFAPMGWVLGGARRRERLGAQVVAAGGFDGVPLGSIDEHHPAGARVFRGAQLPLFGRDPGGREVGLAEVGADDARALDQRGERRARQPSPQLFLLSGQRPQPERCHTASDPPTQALRDAAGGPDVVFEQREHAAGPRSGSVQPSQIGGAGERLHRFGLVEIEIRRAVGHRHVAPAAEKAGNAEALRDVLADMPLVEFGIAVGSDVVPEGENSFAQESHGADPNEGTAARQGVN